MSNDHQSSNLMERLRAALQDHVDRCCATGCGYCREDRALLREADETAHGSLVGYFYNNKPGGYVCCQGRARYGGKDMPPDVCEHGAHIHWEA